MTECTTIAPASTPAFPLDQWYVAGFAWELQDAPLARTLLGRPVVLFRTPDGSVAALEDRCCHRELPLSCGTVEARGPGRGAPRPPREAGPPGAPGAGADTVRARIDQFAARLATTPRALKPEERRALVRELKGDGLLDLRRSMETIAAHLGVSRATVYSYAK